MRRLLVGLLVAGTLVGGAIAYAIAADSPAATAQEDEAPESTDDAATLQDTSTTAPDASTKDDKQARANRNDVLGDVLDEAVADGIITQEQADQLTESFAAKRDEIRAALGSARRDHDGVRGFGRFGVDLRGMLEDGVIDADELAALPDGHPLSDPDGPAAEYLDDGQITQEELDQLVQSFRGGAGLGDGATDKTESGTG